MGKWGVTVQTGTCNEFIILGYVEPCRTRNIFFSFGCTCQLAQIAAIVTFR